MRIWLECKPCCAAPLFLRTKLQKVAHTDASEKLALFSFYRDRRWSNSSSTSPWLKSIVVYLSKQQIWRRVVEVCSSSIIRAVLAAAGLSPFFANYSKLGIPRNMERTWIHCLEDITSIELQLSVCKPRSRPFRPLYGRLTFLGSKNNRESRQLDSVKVPQNNNTS